MKQIERNSPVHVCSNHSPGTKKWKPISSEFFFPREIIKNQSQVITQMECTPKALTNAVPHRSPRAPKGPRRRNHLVQGQGGTEQKTSRLRNPTVLPSPEPRSSTVALQVLGEFTHLGPSELTKEICGFIGPTTSNLYRQHDKTRPAPFSSKLRVRALFASAGLRQGFHLFGGCTSPGTSVCKDDTIVVSMANWDPPKRGSPSATTSSRLPSAWSCCAKSMSRTKTFVRTLAPPSLHTLAAADSNAQPLRPNTPAVAQAARWWPRASSGRPHRQLRTVRRRGKRSLRRRSTRKGAESNLALRSKGKLVNAMLANGPRCDRNIAC